MLSDNHEIEYSFEELQVTMDGVRLDTYFNGAAVLAADAEYSFYVKRIMLDGTVRDLNAAPNFWGVRPRKNAIASLSRPARDDMSFAAHLFRALEEEIYADDAAIKAWQGEEDDAADRESERADYIREMRRDEAHA